MTQDNLKLRDCIQIGTCRPRIRDKVEALGYKMEDLMGEGVPISEVENIDDVHVQRAIKVARARIEKERS